MASVTQRIKEIKQPRGGYINPRLLTQVVLDDEIELNPRENIHPILVGLAVDYLSRFMLGSTAENAFSISLIGAQIIGELPHALRLLKRIKGLNRRSIIAACRLSGYDVCYRAGPLAYTRPVQTIKPDKKTIRNIRTLVERCLFFFEQCGPIVKDGFSFEGGYTQLVNAGDGDYMTKRVLWDLKVSKNPPTKDHTLQLLMYYLLGMHSIHAEFQDIQRLGIFNPRLNTIYYIDIQAIPYQTIIDVSTNVIGYSF